MPAGVRAVRTTRVMQEALAVAYILPVGVFLGGDGRVVDGGVQLRESRLGEPLVARVSAGTLVRQLDGEHR